MSHLTPSFPVSLLLLFFLLFPGGAFSSGSPSPTPAKFEYNTALNISQKAIGNQLGDYRLIGIDNNPYHLSQLRGKPMVLSLIFTSCYQVCPMTIRHLAKAVKKARDSLGEESFNVVVIGFDTAKDTPEAMRHFARQQGIEDDNWKLFSIDAQDVEALTREVGLVYYPSSRGFDHIIQATVVDAEGKVYRQVYGQVFETPLLVEPLKELVLGRPQPSQGFVTNLFNKVRFFCTTYDPVRDAYYFDYSLFIGILIGASIIIFVSVWVVKEALYRRKQPKQFS